MVNTFYIKLSRLERLLIDLRIVPQKLYAVKSVFIMLNTTTIYLNKGETINLEYCKLKDYKQIYQYLAEGYLKII